jgi:hypothetical protein
VIFQIFLFFLTFYAYIPILGNEKDARQEKQTNKPPLPSGRGLFPETLRLDRRKKTETQGSHKTLETLGKIHRPENGGWQTASLPQLYTR